MSDRTPPFGIILYVVGGAALAGLIALWEGDPITIGLCFALILGFLAIWEVDRRRRRRDTTRQEIERLRGDNPS